MKISLAMVISVDGCITNGDDPNIYKWTSPEDLRHFEQLKSEHQVIIMGSKTYLAAKDFIKLQPGKLRLVITRDPMKYANFAVVGQLEFTSETPEKIIDRLRKNGDTKVLLVGGSDINTIFLEAGLIDELIITTEPVLLGKGKSMFHQLVVNYKLELESTNHLNNIGTTYCIYRVIN